MWFSSVAQIFRSIPTPSQDQCWRVKAPREKDGCILLWHSRYRNTRFISRVKMSVVIFSRLNEATAYTDLGKMIGYKLLQVNISGSESLIIQSSCWSPNDSTPMGTPVARWMVHDASFHGKSHSKIDDLYRGTPILENRNLHISIHNSWSNTTYPTSRRRSQVSLRPIRSSFASAAKWETTGDAASGVSAAQNEHKKVVDFRMSERSEKYREYIISTI